MLNLSNEHEKNINSIYIRNDSINSIKNSPTKNSIYNRSNKPSRKTLIRSPFKEKSQKEKEDSEEEEEDEATKLYRIRQERTEFLIKLLTEPSKLKARHNKFMLKPLKHSNYSLNKTLNVSEHTITDIDSLPKYLTLKERRKWEKKIKKEKELREKEKEKRENKQIMKEINNLKKNSHKHIFRSNLNRLYGYNNKFLFYNAKLKKGKSNDLEKYQEDILRVSSINLSKDNMLKLFSDLKNIRLNSEQAKPLPPINFKALVHHSMEESNAKKKYGLRVQSKKFSQMDEYEKELYKIKTTSRHEKLNNTNNKFLYKMYEVLPEHVVDTIYAKKRKF